MATPELPKCGVENPDRWGVLLTFGYIAACNSFMFQSYTTTPHLSKSILTQPGQPPISDSALDFLYTVSLFATLPLMPASAYLLETRHYATQTATVLLNIAAAWTRYLSIIYESYGCAIVSGVTLGSATSIVMPSLALMPMRWCAGAKEQALAAAVCVQSGNLGWALGALIPLVVKSEEAFLSFMLVQAIAVSAALLLFVPLYRNLPERVLTITGESRARLSCVAPRGSSSHVTGAAPDAATALATAESGAVGADHQHLASVAPVRSSGSTILLERAGSSLDVQLLRDGERQLLETAPELTLMENARLLSCHRSYLLHSLCYSLLMGVAYSIPGVQAAVYGALGVSFVAAHSVWTNFSFIFLGVVGGLAAGKLAVSERGAAATLKGMAVVSTLGLAVLCALSSPALVARIGDGPMLLLIFVVVQGVCGAGLLGFIGLGLRVAVQVGAPAAEVYSGLAVEWGSQLWGSLLAQLSVFAGFFSSLAVTAAVAAALLLVARFPGVEQAAPAHRPLGTEPTLVSDSRSVPASDVCLVIS